MSNLKPLYREIWNERSHECEVCGYPISRPVRHVFSHVYSKGAHPSLSHTKENIEIWCSTLVRHDNKVGCHEASHREVEVFKQRVKENDYQKPSLHELKVNIN